MTEEEILKSMLFVPCATKDHLHRWIKIYLGVDYPDSIVCDEYDQNPSNSSPMDLIWLVYSTLLKGGDPNCMQILGYACRGGFKSTSASILEVLCLIHIHCNVAHMAALEVQARNCQDYVERFLKRPYLRDFMTSKNKRNIEVTKYFHNKTGNIISPIEYNQLSDIDKNQYSETINWVKIVIATVEAANGLHSLFVVFDEMDLTEPKVLDEARMIPESDGGRLPVTFLTSTRKYSWGPVQSAIDKADETKLKVLHWNLIDMTQACPPERHLPDEPQIPIYYNLSTLKSISEAEWSLLAEKEQAQYKKKMGYTGCLTQCKVFAACQGKLINKQKSKSSLLKPIDQTQDALRRVSIESALAQYLCFGDHTQIFLSDGTCKDIKDIKIGDLVVTHTGQNKLVKNIFRRKYEGPAFEIYNPGWLWRSPTIITPEHPYFINGHEFKEVKDLKPSFVEITSGKVMMSNKKNLKRIPEDYLSFPSKYRISGQKEFVYSDFVDLSGVFIENELVYPIDKNGNAIPFKMKFTDELGWIIGFYLAEGSLYKYSQNDKQYIGGIIFTTHSDENEYHERIRNFAISLGLKTSEMSFNHLGIKTRRLVIYNSVLGKLFKEICGEYCDKKRIHSKLMSLNEDFLRSIFQGFFDGDGSKTNISSCLEITTTSYSLATQLFLMAQRFKFLPRLRKIPNKNGKKQVYRLNFLNIKHQRHAKLSKFKIEHDYNLYRLDRINKINYSGDVYNLEVEGDNSYIADGAAVHNCLKPSSEGLIYPNFSKDFHMLSAKQMANKITGEDYPDYFSKAELIQLLKELKAEFYSGMDHGYTHLFAVTTAALIGHIMYVIDVIGVRGMELQQRVELCKERLKPLNPVIYPDNAYPADNATFRRNGFRLVDFDKDVLAGIESVRARLSPGRNLPCSIYLLKGDTGCEQLANDLQEYHWKTNAQGEMVDEPAKIRDDRPDSLRYLCQNVSVNKVGAILAKELGPLNIYSKKNPQEGWMKEKVKELTSDGDSPDFTEGGSGNLKFLI